MTEQRSRSRPAKIPLRSALALTMTLSMVVAVLIAGGIAWQMARGNDPALASKLPASGRSAEAQNTASAAGTAAPADQAAPALSRPAPPPAPIQTTTS